METHRRKRSATVPQGYYAGLDTADLVVVAANGGMTDPRHNVLIWAELRARRARDGTLNIKGVEKTDGPSCG